MWTQDTAHEPALLPTEPGAELPTPALERWWHSVAGDQGPTCIPNEGEDWGYRGPRKGYTGLLHRNGGGVGPASGEGPRQVAAGALGLFAHLQQGVDGCVPVPSLGFQHGADHLPVHVGEHVLDGFQIVLAAAGLGAHGRRRQGHGHHAGAAHGGHTCKRDAVEEHTMVPRSRWGAPARGPPPREVHATLSAQSRGAPLELWSLNSRFRRRGPRSGPRATGPLVRGQPSTWDAQPSCTESARNRGRAAHRVDPSAASEAGCARRVPSGQRVGRKRTAAAHETGEPGPHP